MLANLKRRQTDNLLYSKLAVRFPFKKMLNGTLSVSNINAYQNPLERILVRHLQSPIKNENSIGFSRDGNPRHLKSLRHAYKKVSYIHGSNVDFYVAVSRTSSS